MAQSKLPNRARLNARQFQIASQVSQAQNRVVFPEEGHQPLDRARFQLRATGVKLEGANPLRSGIHTRGYLPHIKREGAAYFVTFRLEDSLPQAVLQQIQQRRAERLQTLRSIDKDHERSATNFGELERRIERDYFREVESFLDRGTGGCFLARPKIAEITAGALAFFHQKRYRLDSWVIMPNHVHVVLWPFPNELLGEILRSWKQFTARKANELLARTGRPFWQRESYDHWIRSDAEHARCSQYVENNPVKAKLCSDRADWKWSSASKKEHRF